MCLHDNHTICPGVPREVFEHHWAVLLDARPIRQKVRRQTLERQDVIRLEVDKLPRAGFIRELGQNVEAYVDDLVVKTRSRASLIDDLDEMFRSLRQTRMMLNP